MDSEGKAEGTMSAADMLIWLVRVILPMVLFWIWCQTQPKGTGGKHCYLRKELLEARQAPEAEEPPEQLRTLRLVAEAQVQQILGGPAFRGGPGGPGAGRRESGGKGGGKRGEKATGQRPGGPAMPSGAAGCGGGEAPGRSLCPPASAGLAAGGATAGTGGPGGGAGAGDRASEQLGEEERMHLESLLNFVAFRYKDRPKRTFLPREQCPPPPPPRRPHASASSSSAAAGEADAEAAAKANAEAQMVLKGVVNPKVGLRSAEVAKALSEQLAESGVRPSEATFALMVESCANAGDRKAASDCLMQMESSGYCADSELLDKVINLYAETRGKATARRGTGSSAREEPGGSAPFTSTVSSGGEARGTAPAAPAPRDAAPARGWRSAWSEDED